MAKKHQVAALPVRIQRDGTRQILLVTSRDTGRWVIPKGWPWPGHADVEAAAGEAWEEAGIRGEMQAASIGSFTYRKRLARNNLKVTVDVYLLIVTKVFKSWPEQKARQRKWFIVADAAALVEETKLRKLMLDLDQTPARPRPA